MPFKWEVPPEQAFAALYDDYAKRIIAGIQRLAKAYAAEIEAFMKASGTWQDQTGNLRASLYAEVETTLTEITLFFDYGLDYGYWIAYANQGKYDIIARVTASPPLPLSAKGIARRSSSSERSRYVK
jgi:hypothetical protein